MHGRNKIVSPRGGIEIYVFRNSTYVYAGAAPQILGRGVGPKPGHTKTTPTIKNSPDLIYYFLKRDHFPYKKSIPVKKMGSSAISRGYPPVSPTGGGTYHRIPPGGAAPVYMYKINEDLNARIKSI